MKVLNKITYRSLKMNKKRSIGTIIGIMLSVALICAIGGLGTSYLQTLINNAIAERGYQHVEVVDVDEAKIEELKVNRDVAEVRIMRNAGTFLNKEYNFVDVYSMEHSLYDDLKFELLEGRLPENENEVVVCSELILGEGYKVGEKIDFYEYDETKVEEYYKLRAEVEDAKEKNIVSQVTNTQTGILESYDIVGVVSKGRWSNEEEYVITKGNVGERYNAFVTLKNPMDYRDSIDGIVGTSSEDKISNVDGSYNYNLNDELLKWEGLAFSEVSMRALMSIVGIVMCIVLIISVFCIRNSFEISITEKLKIYGMFASVGATKKQIKKSVIYEGFLLGLIGIPLGILAGCLAVVILVKVMNYVAADIMFEYTKLVAKITISPIIISVILGALTIYFSAISAARKASKVSPIENIRSSNDIKINKKKLRIPAYIKKFFNMGGVIAYKNLKRSKKKYRTTVIALVISVFSFISVNAFMEEVFVQEMTTYADAHYNIYLGAGSYECTGTEEERIADMDGVEECHAIYRPASCSYIQTREISKVNDILNKECFKRKDKIGRYYNVLFIALSNEEFNEYAKELKLDPEIVKKDGILCDGYGNLSKFYYGNITDEKDYDAVIGEKERAFKYNTGDNMEATMYDGVKNVELSFKLAKVTDKCPKGSEGYTSDSGCLGYLVVNKESYPDYNWLLDEMAIKAKDSYKLEKQLRSAYPYMEIQNIDSDIKAQNGIAFIYNVFLYGFIGVITLIGITNIFNTISSNIELRQKEFAMLKSVGMTEKEFNRMIRLETFFYSVKALIYGIITGIFGAYMIHKAFAIREVSTFNVPYRAIILSIIFVIVIVYSIMRYSVRKIGKKNIIETIRNDNI